MSNASNPLKWAFVLLGIALLATAVGIGAFYSNPVGIGMTLARQALDRMGLERQAFDAPAGRLLYWRGGAGEPVVLVHGMGNQAGTWVKIAADLSHSARLIVPDLPGHGDSAPYEGELTLRDEVAGLAALIDRESPDTPVTLVGNSMGGWVSLLYAAEHPDRVRRVIALNSAGLEYDLGDLTLVPSTREEARALVTAMSPEGVGLPRDFVIDDLIEKITDGAGPRLIAGHDPRRFPRSPRRPDHRARRSGVGCRGSAVARRSGGAPGGDAAQRANAPARALCPHSATAVPLEDPRADPRSAGRVPCLPRSQRAGSHRPGSRGGVRAPCRGGDPLVDPVMDPGRVGGLGKC